MTANSGVSDDRRVDRRTVLKTTGIAAATGVASQAGTAAGKQVGAGADGTAVSASSSVSGTTGTIQQQSGRLTSEELTIESWDGTELAATLFTPAERGPHPVVLMTHGWGAFRQSPITKPKALNYAENGYAVLTYDSRGFAGSAGEVGLNGPNEVKDTQHLITWLANRSDIATEGADNPWIGMDGISYAGGIQFQAAAADDRLDALVPRITWNDIEYSLTPDGVVKIGWLSALLGLGEFNTLLDGDAELTDDLGEWYWHAAENNAVPEDAVEKFREISVAYDDVVDTPTFLLQGWNDSLFNPSEALETYRELQDRGVESRLAFYEGGHDLTEVIVDFEDRGKMNDDALAWMDRHVRGKDEDIAQVQNYLPQRDSWRTDEQWPPEDVALAGYSLGESEASGDHRIEQADSIFDWSAQESVTYEWAVGEDIEAIGEPEIELDVQVHGPEARLFFELHHEGSTINGMDEAVLLDGQGRHTISVTYPGIQQFLSEGDTLGLEISVSNTWYLDSRRSDGVTIDPAGSRLLLPQRPDENPEDGEEGCFITTATAREQSTLDSLRRFRDDSMSKTPLGRALVGLYYRISPPIATTLEQHPESATASLTRSLVQLCAGISDRQAATDSRVRSVAFGVFLTALYVIGTVTAALGHGAISLRE